MRQYASEIMGERPGERRGVVWRRVGFDDEALKHWLMRFGDEDLSKADTERRDEMREQLSCWLILSELPDADRPRYRNWPSPSARAGTAVDEQVTLEANKWWRALLMKATHPEAPTLVAPNITFRVDIVRHRHGWALLSQIEAPDLDKFQFFVRNALAAYRGGLRLCQRCSKIFLPSGKQRYCSRRCSNTERKSRFRQSQRQRALGKAGT
jgi:hypothetical protein